MDTFNRASDDSFTMEIWGLAPDAHLTKLTHIDLGSVECLLQLGNVIGIE